MDNVIRVNPEDLKAAAGRLADKSAAVKNLTQNMTQKVVELTGRIWSGEAQTQYVTKFKGLEDDILRLTKLIEDNVNHLNQIAAEYQSTEATNVSQAGKLSSKVII